MRVPCRIVPLLLSLLLLSGCASSPSPSPSPEQEHEHEHEHDSHSHAHSHAHAHGGHTHSHADVDLSDPVARCLSRTAAIHGAAGPFAVAGYRIGERALAALGVKRGEFGLRVVHKSPAQVQWSCVCDGLQAATGASPGKLNLRWEKVDEPTQTESVVTLRGSDKTFRAHLKPSFVRRFRDLPREKLAAAGREVAELPEAMIFDWSVEP